MIEIKVDNVEQVSKALNNINFRKWLNSAIKKSILMLERTWKTNTPVVTGLLRNSYESIFGDLEGTLRNFREYAPYVEARRGFLARTVSEEETNIQDLFVVEIEALLKNI